MAGHTNHVVGLDEYDFLTADEAEALFSRAMMLHPDKSDESPDTDMSDKKKKSSFEMYPPLTMFGRPANMQRGVGFYSDVSEGYRYSGQLSASRPLQEWMGPLLAQVNEMFGTGFNGILLNYYPDGEHYIGKHSDDESALSTSKKYVVALSLGATRKFRVRNKATGEIVKDVPTVAGRLLVMSGEFQSEYHHEVPVEKKIKLPRISLTFRRHVK